MSRGRIHGAIAALALLSTSAGCGAADDDARSAAGADPSTSTSIQLDTTAATDAADSRGAEETPETRPTEDSATPAPEPSELVDDTAGDDTMISSDTWEGTEQETPRCTQLSDDEGRTLDEVVAEAPAPDGLAGADLPATEDDVTAVLEALPDELIGGSKQIIVRAPGHLTAAYQPADLASQYGFQALDLRTGLVGSLLPEPRADMFVAFWVVSDDDDHVVEAAGHEGALYWVTFTSTASGYGIDGTEELFTVAWGERCRPWGFTAAAPTPVGRDELVAAFVAATAGETS